jgi:hypothetical protein
MIPKVENHIIIPSQQIFCRSSSPFCLPKNSSILNHKDRPIFLTALIKEFQINGCSFDNDDCESLEVMARWYLSREIPVTALWMDCVDCPQGIIRSNTKYLKDIYARLYSQCRRCPCNR